MEIRVNGAATTVTMRTPGSDVELAQGFLLTEGVIGQRGDILTRQYCRGAGDDGVNTYNVLDVTLAQGVPTRPSTSPATSTPPRRAGYAARLHRRHPADQPAFPGRRSHGGRLRDAVGHARPTAPCATDLRRYRRLHGAALFDADGTMLVVREDIGRHNAVDKVIGWALENDRIPLTGPSSWSAGVHRSS